MKNRANGFTILELLSVVVIIAILGAIAVISYQKYSERARGAEIIEKYDALRTGVHAKGNTAKFDDCAVLAGELGSANLASEYATLAYGFEAVSGGYRPVLTICAQARQNGSLGTMVARDVHDTMTKTGAVEKGAVLTESVVSFALRLSDGDAPLCKTYSSQTRTACGAPQVAAQAATPTTQPTEQPTAPQGRPKEEKQTKGVGDIYCSTDNAKAVGWGLDNCRAWYQANPCPAGTERVLDWPRAQPPGSIPSSCQPPCPPGEVRDSLQPMTCVGQPKGGTSTSNAVQLPDKPSAQPGQPAESRPSGATSGSAAGPDSGINSGAASNPAQTAAQIRQQCINRCRQTICLNCNSRAYRTCVAACP